jgi:hypothetical protein
MKHLATWLLAMALLLTGGVPFSAAETIQLRQSGGTTTPLGGVGDAAKFTKNTTDAGEDVSVDVQKVEERYLTIPIGGTDAMVAADQLYKSNNGYVRDITCYSDATATAGTIALRDSAVAGAGNILWSFDVLAVAYNTPFTVNLQTPFSVGLYLDFTTTADVKCMVRFR